jgi:hypothetical protein
MSNQISSLEKTDSDRMIKESKAEADAEQKARKALDQKDQQSTARNNDSDIAPEKDKNDVMRGHE